MVLYDFDKMWKHKYITDFEWR